MRSGNCLDKGLAEWIYSGLWMLAGKVKIKFGSEVLESTRYRVIELPDTSTLEVIKSGEPY